MGGSARGDRIIGDNEHETAVRGDVYAGAAANRVELALALYGKLRQAAAIDAKAHSIGDDLETANGIKDTDKGRLEHSRPAGRLNDDIARSGRVALEVDSTAAGE